LLFLSDEKAKNFLPLGWTEGQISGPPAQRFVIPGSQSESLKIHTSDRGHEFRVRDFVTPRNDSRRSPPERQRYAGPKKKPLMSRSPSSGAHSRDPLGCGVLRPALPLSGPPHESNKR
jgi:hypothetical protein